MTGVLKRVMERLYNENDCIKASIICDMPSEFLKVLHENGELTSLFSLNRVNCEFLCRELAEHHVVFMNMLRLGFPLSAILDIAHNFDELDYTSLPVSLEIDDVIKNEDSLHHLKLIIHYLQPIIHDISTSKASYHLHSERLNCEEVQGLLDLDLGFTLYGIIQLNEASRKLLCENGQDLINLASTNINSSTFIEHFNYSSDATISLIKEYGSFTELFNTCDNNRSKLYRRISDRRKEACHYTLNF